MRRSPTITTLMDNGTGSGVSVSVADKPSSSAADVISMVFLRRQRFNASHTRGSVSTRMASMTR